MGFNHLSISFIGGKSVSKGVKAKIERKIKKSFVPLPYSIISKFLKSLKSYLNSFVTETKANSIYDNAMKISNLRGGQPFLNLVEIQKTKGWEETVKLLSDKQRASILLKTLSKEKKDGLEEMEESGEGYIKENTEIQEDFDPQEDSDF